MDPALSLLAGSGLAAAAGSALYLRSLFRPLKVRGIPVLRYRLVGPPRPGSPLNELRVSVSRFEAQVRYLSRRGFQAVPLDEAVRKRRSQAFLREDPVALTFDGPYASFREVAWPILQRHGMTRVTLFFPPARLGDAELAFSEGRPEPLLSPEDLAGLLQAGVTLGMQAAPSPDADPDSFLAQLHAGRTALQAYSRQPVDCVSLPIKDPAASAESKRAGFLAAAVQGEGILLKGSPRYAIPRFAVLPATSLLELAVIVSRRVGATQW